MPKVIYGEDVLKMSEEELLMNLGKFMIVVKVTKFSRILFEYYLHFTRPEFVKKYNLLINSKMINHFTLTLAGEDIQKWPETLTYIHHDLNLNIAKLDYLIDNMTVNGNLYLNASTIKALPEHLQVKGHLDIRGTGITQWPKTCTYESIDFDNFAGDY